MRYNTAFLEAWPAATMQGRLAAVPCGRYKGRRIYRFPVLIRFNDSQRLETVAEIATTCMAATAAEAANWVRDQVATRPETEVLAIGPKGGKAKRYVGWESAIGSMLFREHGPVQLDAFPETLTRSPKH